MDTLEAIGVDQVNFVALYLEAIVERCCTTAAGTVTSSITLYADFVSSVYSRKTPPHRTAFDFSELEKWHWNLKELQENL